MDGRNDSNPDAAKGLSASLGVLGETSTLVLPDSNLCALNADNLEKTSVPISTSETSNSSILENASKMESEKEGGDSHGRKDTSPVRPCSILLDRTEVTKYLTRGCKRKPEKESPIEKMEKEGTSTLNPSKNKKINENKSGVKINITSDEEIIKANTELSCKYVCSMCTELYDSVVALRKHALKIHNKRLRSVTVTSSYLKCKICTNNIVSTEINIHMKSLHPEIFIKTNINSSTKNTTQLKLKVFLCTNCSECFSNKSELDKHFKLTHHDEIKLPETYKCNNCNECYTDLQLHLLECTAANKRGKRMRKCKNVTEVIVSSDSECSADSTDFYCVDCDGEFATKNEYQCHFDTCSVTKKKTKKLKTTKVNPIIKVSSDDVKISNSKSKTIVVNTSNKKSLLKRSCTKTSDTDTNIVDTQKATQSVKETPKVDHKTQQSQVQFFSCKLCNYFVLTYKDLLEHMYTYHCVLFKCHTCLGNFKNVADYSNHLKKDHSMEKLNLDYNAFKRSPSSMHACKKCDSAFETEKSLDYHMILHKNYEYLYSKLNCIYCDQICNDYETLQEHVNNTHLFCKICDILFVSDEKCKQHKNDHKLGVIKFYVCQYCCNTFKSLQEFNDHCSTYHKIGNLANVSHFTIIKYPQEKLTPILNHLPCPYCESCLEPKYLLQHFKSSHNLEICEKCKYYVIKSNAKICKGCIIKQKEIDENNMKIYASIIQKRKLASEKYQKEKEEEEKRLKNAIDNGTLNTSSSNNSNKKVGPIKNLGRKNRKQPDIQMNQQYQSPVTLPNPLPQDPLAITSTANPLNYTQPSSTVTSDTQKSTSYAADNAQSNVIINQTFNFVPIPTNFNQPSYVYPSNPSNTQPDIYLGYPAVSNVPQKRDTVIKNLPEYSSMPTTVSYYQRNYTGIESNYQTQNTTDTRNWYPLSSTTTDSNSLISNTDKPYYDYNNYTTQYQTTNNYLQDKVKPESEYGHCNYNMTQFSSNNTSSNNVKSNSDITGIVYDKNQFDSVQYSMLHPSNQGLGFPKLSEVKSESEFSSYVFSDYKLDADQNL